MPWTTSLDELRTLLNDGPTDKYRYRKQLFGQINGVNGEFKSLEYRRITDFTTAIAPLGVYVNDVLVASGADDPATGEVALTAPPVDGDKVTASYYSQYFIDAELNQFLIASTKWMDLGTDPTTLGSCLQQAALKYAAHQAYQKLSLRFLERLSEMYRVEDSVKADQTELVAQFKALSDDFYAAAVKARNDCYARSGKSEGPSWGFVTGSVRDIQPKR